MSNYTVITDFAAKDALSHGDPAKAGKGAEVAAELNAIATMSTTKSDKNEAQIQVWCGTAGGTANALTISPATAIAAYAAGQTFRFKSGASPNSGATTIAISGLAAKEIQATGNALAGGEIVANKIYSITYDGTAFQITGMSVAETYTPAGAGAVATTVQSKLREFVSVKDFGAVGNGATDDAVAIQAAINSLPSTGGTIYFPTPTVSYKINSSLVISGKTGITLQGSSKDGCALVKTFTNSGNALIHLKNANYFKIDSIFLQGVSDTTGVDDLLFIEGSSYGVVSNSKIFNGRGYGINIKQGTGTSGSYYTTLIGNHLFNNGIGLGASGANLYIYDGNETKILGGDYTSSPGAGIVVVSANGVVAQGASFEGNTNYGAYIGTAGLAAEVNFFGCRFEGAGIMQYGIYINNINSTVGIFGCHLTSNVIGDVYDPNSAVVSWSGNSTSSSPAVYQAIGIKIPASSSGINWGNGFMKLTNNSGVAEFKGSSSTRLTTAANGLELGSANGIIYLDTPVTTLNWMNVSGVVWMVGSGSPAGVITAAPGSLYLNIQGGAGTTLYVKESGTGNIGWVAK